MTFRRLGARVDAKNDRLRHLSLRSPHRCRGAHCTAGRTTSAQAPDACGLRGKTETGIRPTRAMKPARRNVSRTTCRLTGSTVSYRSSVCRARKSAVDSPGSLHDGFQIADEPLQAAHGDGGQRRYADRHAQEAKDERHGGGDAAIGVRRGVDGRGADRREDETKSRAGHDESRDHADQRPAAQTRARGRRSRWRRGRGRARR